MWRWRLEQYFTKGVLDHTPFLPSACSAQFLSSNVVGLLLLLSQRQCVSMFCPNSVSLLSGLPLDDVARVLCLGLPHEELQRVDLLGHVFRRGSGSLGRARSVARPQPSHQRHLRCPFSSHLSPRKPSPRPLEPSPLRSDGTTARAQQRERARPVRLSPSTPSCWNGRRSDQRRLPSLGGNTADSQTGFLARVDAALGAPREGGRRGGEGQEGGEGEPTRCTSPPYHVVGVKSQVE